MKRTRAPSSPCSTCSQSCRSLLAAQRAQGNNAFDQLRHEYTFRSGQNITFVQEGRLGFYCIQVGYVKLNYRAKRVYRAVRISGPSHIIGFVNQVSDAYSATALSPVTACFFDLEIFFMLAEKSRGMSQSIIKWLCELIVVRDDRIVALGSRSAIAKVATTLISLVKKFGMQNPDGSIDILAPVDRSTLSDLSGMAIETFSRVLTELEEGKIVARNKRAIRILDFHALKECMKE